MPAPARLILACLLLWPVVSWAAPAQPQPGAFAYLRAAEAADLHDLALAARSKDLRAYRVLLAADRDRTLAALAPLFSPRPDGWLDCKSARQALSAAVDATTTPVGLEMAVSMGVRTEDLHCHGVGEPGGWVGGIPDASARVVASLPPGFAYTTQALDWLQPIDWLIAARRHTVPGPVGCLPRRLAAARAAGQQFSKALDRALDACSLQQE